MGMLTLVALCFLTMYLIWIDRVFRTGMMDCLSFPISQQQQTQNDDLKASTPLTTRGLQKPSLVDLGAFKAHKLAMISLAVLFSVVSGCHFAEFLAQMTRIAVNGPITMPPPQALHVHWEP